MAQVLKFLLLSVMILACAALAEGEKREISSLKNVNGKCHYQGIVLNDGQSMKAGDYCEKWTCRKGKIVIKGCKLPPRYGSCTYWKGRWSYPSCCSYERVC